MEHFTERIETASHRRSEFNDCARLFRKADEISKGLMVDLAAINNDIQMIQEETNRRNADLREEVEEVVEARAATDRENTQLNRDQMRLN